LKNESILRNLKFAALNSYFTSRFFPLEFFADTYLTSASIFLAGVLSCLEIGISGFATDSIDSSMIGCVG